MRKKEKLEGGMGKRQRWAPHFHCHESTFSEPHFQAHQTRPFSPPFRPLLIANHATLRCTNPGPLHHRLRQRHQRARRQQLHQRHLSLELPIQPVAYLDRDERVEPVRHDGFGRRDVVAGDHEDGSEFVAQGAVDGVDGRGEGSRLAELGRRGRGIRGWGGLR